MPVLAIAIADVLVRDLDPAVALGLGDHPLDEATVLLFGICAARDLRLRLADANQERVANPLELGRSEDARTANSAYRPVDSLARKGSGPKLRKLLFEARDLAAELVAEGTLVRGGECGERHLSPAATDRSSVVLECLRHSLHPASTLATS
jgi:hypothetical protein